MVTLIDNEEMSISLSEGFISNTKTPDKRPLSDYILNKTLEKYELFRKMFKVEKLEKINFEIYDNYDEWKKIYIKRFGVEPPEYSRGSVIPKENISFSVKHNNPMYNTSMWYHTLGVNAHEAFHLYYLKYIYKDENDRIVWFDEGMAQFLSGEKDSWINDEELLKTKFIEYNNSYIPIYNLNDRIQGNSNISDNLIFSRDGVIDGYKTSFFIILYLFETRGFDYLVLLMKDNNEIKKIGETAIEDMRNYFIKKYDISNNKSL